ncbi:MAG: transcriptional regulator [Elusimicrobia bacterium CG08_land_8_20_14_0_20_59_10]|nr:MAG: transcriptional regulator [Elusimicrobia bacterium CG08_land_8_20_14_0_20_59_10]
MKIKNKCREAARTLAGRLAAIAHPSRFLIVCLLSEREMFVQEILEYLGTTKGNISQHLSILSYKGFIAGRKDGNKVFYSIKDEKIEILIKELKKIYCPDFRIKL